MDQQSFSLNRALSINGIVIITVGLFEYGLQMTSSFTLLLLMIWALLFFPLFYIRGQKAAFPVLADMVSAGRLVAALLFTVLLLFDCLTPLWALIITLVIEIADGLDGWIARRFGETEFGAIWDMECDAFIILLLSQAAVLIESMPIWMLLPGLFRYVFYFPIRLFRPAGTFFPRSLSWFSKTVCVAAVFSLASVWYLPQASAAAVGIVTALLLISFLWETFFYVSLRIQTLRR